MAFGLPVLVSSTVIVNYKSHLSRQVVNIEDLRRLAQHRLPRSVFDYLDGGAEAEITLAENCRAFRDVIFRPRGAIAIAIATSRLAYSDTNFLFLPCSLQWDTAD